MALTPPSADLPSMKRIAAAFVMVALAIPGARAEEPARIALLTTYKCKPADRPALREYLEGPAATQIAQWRRDRKFDDSLLLFGLDVDDQLWDALLLLRFDSWSQYASWKDVEKNFPAGLTRSALELTSGVASTLAEVAWEGSVAAEKRKAVKAVYFVRPYYFDDRNTYRKFFDAYNKPQFQAWLREGAITRYWGVLNQNPSGHAWGVQLIYEYPGWEAATGRDSLKAGLAPELKGNAAWDLLGEVKDKIRSAGRVTLAEAIPIR
jgi:hypothetical protein